MASDDLYLLDMRNNGEQMATWMVVPVIGQTPGRRYAHTLVFKKPYLILFGGNTGTEPTNDVWCFSVDKAPFSWQKLETAGSMPMPRNYHSAAMCTEGSAQGMMVVFGGRSNDQKALKDTWGLRRHRNGSWDWIKAPSKGNGDEPMARYQHSSIFIGTLMIILGGRTNLANEHPVMEVYDSEKSIWKRFNSVMRFRHTIWSNDARSIYMHGGFENETPSTPNNKMIKLDLLAHFEGHDKLIKKIQNVSD